MLLVFYIILTLPLQCLQRLLPYTLLNSTLTTQFTGLSNFTIDLMNFSGNKKFLIFGGTKNNIPQNTLLQITFQNKITTIYNPDIKPPPRSQHCTLIHQYKYYIYGGIDETGKILSDLWQFNSIFKTWAYISAAPFSLVQCHIVRNISEIVIFGISRRQKVCIVKYSLLTGDWNQVEYYYGNSLTIQGKMYQGSIKQTQISIQQLPSLYKQQTNIHFVNQISTTTTLHVLPYNEIMGLYFLLTDSKITIFHIFTQKILLLKNLKSIVNNYEALISGSWLFFIQTDQVQIRMEYYNLENMEIVGLQEYLNPETYSQYQLVIVDGDIIFVSQSTMRTWELAQHCEWGVNYTHISSCFYNKIHCEDGYVGELCQIRQCPNTLRLFDPIKKQQILYECSNHGECTENGCQCDLNWSGPDCSTYTSLYCNDEKVDNWPVVNCQCYENTTGGNSCEVKFCYNDCSSHGTCLSTGKCLCQANYYGQDCSITIIEFPGATINIW